MTRQEPRRLGKQPYQQRRRDDGHDATDDEERTPAERRQQPDAQQTGQRGAERNADDRHRHRNRTLADGHELSSQRRSVRHCPAETDAGKQSQDPELHW